jgi:hypothetical protein
MFEAAPDAEWSETWKLTEALYRRLAREVRESGAELLVAMLPSRAMVLDDAWASLRSLAPQQAAAWDRDHPRARLAAFFEAQGIAFVDLTASFRRKLVGSGARSPFFLVDPHLTAEGHLLIADAIEPALTRAIRPRP